MRAQVEYWFAETGQSSPGLKTRTEWLAVGAIAALAVALRLSSQAMKSDLWYDEVCSYTVAGRSFSEMMHLLYLGADTNPPLYTVLLHFWLKLGGSDTHVKLFSLLFATASVGVLYLLARRIAGRYVALISCSLFASSPSVITYSVEARPYALFLFLSLLSTHLLLSAVQKVAPHTRCRWRISKLWLGYSVVVILTVYTHWFGLLLLGVQAAALVIYYPSSRHAARRYFISLMAVACCCLPLAPFLRNQIALQNVVGGYAWPGKPGLRSVANLAVFLAGGENLFALITLLAIIVCLSRRRRTPSATVLGRRGIAFFTSYLVLPVLAVFTLSNLLVSNSFFVNRYFLPFVVSVHLLTALGLSRLNKRTAFVFVLTFALFPLVKTARHWRAPETPYSQAASELSGQSREDVLIAHLSPMSYYPMLHYCRNSGATERILWARARGGYETAYNLAGEMLTGGDLMEVGTELHKYKEIWVIIDPMDRDDTLGDASEYIRNDRDFILESEKQIRQLQLRHYRLRGMP